jgi:hypothetical protein
MLFRYDFLQVLLRDDFLRSVADSGCLSRILIFTHPGSRIFDPGSNHSNKRGGRKIFLSFLFL